MPANATPKNVRRFGTFTADLGALADWFKECGITSVAMEATGVYWIPVFQVLEERGSAVILVNARQTKNVAGRKSAVQDCQWIQRLHMQKALQQMNVQLTQVLSDVTGGSGMAILEAILAGERDPVKLAALVDRRVRATPIQMQKALEGDCREGHLFVLQQAFSLYATYEEKIHACDEQIVRETATLLDKVDPLDQPLPPREEGRPASKDKMPDQDMREVLYRNFGADLTAIGTKPVCAGRILSSDERPARSGRSDHSDRAQTRPDHLPSDQTRRGLRSARHGRL